MKHKKLLSLALGLAAVLPLATGAPVMAWGPERPTYTLHAPADHATFNSITDNSALGDERDFVRIVEVDSGNTFTSELEIEPDKEYAVYIYYHNDASATFNDEAHGFAGVARDARVISYYPKELAAGERGKIDGIISSTNASPQTVWDEAYITATKDLSIRYVDGTARIYNQHETNKALLSDELFTGNGVLLGVDSLNGIVLGCDEYAGQVIYRLRTYAAGEDVPETPVPEDKPETPSALPTTGPVEIVLAVVVVIAVIAGIVYFVRTHKAVKKVAKKAKGRK